MTVTFDQLMAAATEEHNEDALHVLRDAEGDLSRIPKTLWYVTFEGVSDWFVAHGFTEGE